MDGQRKSAASPEPPPVEAVRDQEVAAAGGQAIAAMMVATEERVAKVFGDAERAVAAMALETELRSLAQNARRREELSVLRRDLTDSASALAHRFEALLDLLEDADDELARRAGQARPRRLRDAGAEGVRMTVRERRLISFAHEPGTPGPGPVEAGGTRRPGPKRRRWWRLWTRKAA